ncbi:quaternary ammonium compound efflux SMR transporter SugE [Tepidibacillus marianensis]|uniref:quaternary ammonium compound efflux SMR transporter SugE n=1 Tax=Tepidibacillus marianensis TaxID=3131995 RepID=UPI0030CDFB71
MAWFSLFIAGLLETAWAIGLKYSHGFTKLWPSVGTILAMIGSFVLLSRSLKVLSIGTAYAVWTGIGAVGTVILGMVLFQEPKDFSRIVFIGLIIIGIVGLQYSSSHM